MKIGILFDGASAFAEFPDLSIIGTVDAVAASLEPEGNTVVRIPVHPDSKWVDKLKRARVDLVFNLCESIDGVAAVEPAVISVLELLGLPYTGSSSWTTALCLRKHVVNAALERAGLPCRSSPWLARGVRSHRSDSRRSSSRPRRTHRSAWSSARSCEPRVSSPSA